MRSHTFALHGHPDLLDYYDPSSGFFFERATSGVCGIGVALRVEVPAGPDQVARAAEAARVALSRVETSSGPPPLIVGALPFDGERTNATLVMPRISIVRRDGQTWMIEAGQEGTPEPEIMPHEPPPEPWTSLRVRPDPAPEVYVEAARAARDRIRSGALDKVVLARTLIAESDHVFDIPALLERLRSVEPAAYVFAVNGFIGASPELLLARAGDTVRSNPLAGTIPRGADSDADAAAVQRLMASDKDRREHALVVDAVREALTPVCESLDVDEQPSPLHTSKVWHLSTEAAGILRSPAPGALDLAARLHPTPAVCGTPRGRALDEIRALEPVERGSYAGLVGWMDANGDGEWAVALRCAQVSGSVARLYAGAGIVAASEPEAELAETDAKFRGLLDALGYA